MAPPRLIAKLSPGTPRNNGAVNLQRRESHEIRGDVLSSLFMSTAYRLLSFTLHLHTFTFRSFIVC